MFLTGELFCEISTFVFWFIPTNNKVIVIAVMSLYRLWVLRKPKAYRDNIPIYKVKLLMLAIFIVSSTTGGVYLGTGTKAAFDPMVLTCVPSDYLMKSESHLNMIMSVVFIGIPLVTVIISNLTILIFVITQSIKVGASQIQNISTIITLLGISWVFIISFVPIIIRDVVGHGDWYMTFQIYTLSISVIANPIICTIRNDTFRNYLVNVLLCKTAPIYEGARGEERCVTGDLKE